MKITKRQLKSLVREVIEESKISKRPFRLKEESNEDIDVYVNVGYGDGQYNFDENFERVGNSEDEFVYVDWGNLSGDLPDISDLEFNYTNDQYNKLAKETEGYTGIDYIEDGYSIGDIIDDYAYNAMYDSSMQEVLENLEDEFDIASNYDDVIAEIETSGYSQGDVATVYVNIPEFEKVTGRKWDDKLESDLSKEFSHYFWDAPMIARVEIDGEEYICDEYDDLYEEMGKLEYDKDEFIKCILDQYDGDVDKEFLKEILEEEVPSELS